MKTQFLVFLVLVLMKPLRRQAKRNPMQWMMHNQLHFKLCSTGCLFLKMPDGLSPKAQDFIELVHIQTETSLPGRYIAEIDVCFSPLMVRGLFKENEQSWAECNEFTCLVLPVFASPAGVREHGKKITRVEDVARGSSRS